MLTKPTARRIFVLLFVLLSALSFAQTEELLDMTRHMIASPISLFQVAELKTELALTKDQGTRIEAIRDAYTKEMHETMDNLTPDEPAKMLAAFRKMTGVVDNHEKAIFAVFDTTQAKRFREMQMQVMGPTALYEKDIQKSFSLTSDQVKKVAEIKSGEFAALAKAKQDAAESGEPGAFGKNLREYNASRDKKLLAILTPEQQAKLTSLQGAPSAAVKKYLG